MAETNDQIEQWAQLPDEQWVAAHAPRFAAVRQGYIDYEGFLKAVLKLVRQRTQMAQEARQPTRPTKSLMPNTSRMIRKRNKRPF